jgi:hypothetical protein
MIMRPLGERLVQLHQRGLPGGDGGQFAAELTGGLIEETGDLRLRGLVFEPLDEERWSRPIACRISAVFPMRRRP